MWRIGYFLAALVWSGFAQAQMPVPIVADTPIVVGGGTSQVFASGTATVTSANRYLPLTRYVNAAQGTNYIADVAPIAGVLSNLRVQTTVAPTGAQTWTLTLTQNNSGTALTCTINASSSPAGTCADTTHTVTVAAGDYFVILSATTNSPSNSIHSVSAVFTPTTTNETWLPSVSNGTFSTSVQNAVPIYDNFTPGALASRLQGVSAVAGNLDYLYVILASAPGTAASGKKYDWALAKNGSTTSAPACQILEVATTCNDVSTGALAIADGDNIAFAGTPTSTPTGAVGAFGARLVPTTSGQFSFTNTGGTANDSASVTTYFGLTGAVSATRSAVQNISNSMTIDKMEVKLSGTAGGGGKVFTLNQNSNPTALTCSIAAGASTCSITGTITVADNDLIDIEDVPTSTPTVRAVTISIIAHR